MPIVIAIAGFLGAWFLVAGPLMQAWLELNDEQLDHERFEATVSDIPKPEKISAWWWLLPPIAWILTRRRGTAYRNAVMRSLDQDLAEASVSFFNKANGWFIVASGAALLGIKETWELAEALELPIWAFWVLVILAPILCIVNLVVRISSSEKMMGHEKPPRGTRPDSSPST
jgi:hypothetical protein